MRGALTIDGALRSRAEKEHTDGSSAPSMLHELLVEGHIVESGSVLKKPLFWIAIVVAAGATAVLTYYLTTLPHTATVRPP